MPLPGTHGGQAGPHRITLPLRVSGLEGHWNPNTPSPTGAQASLGSPWCQAYQYEMEVGLWLLPSPFQSGIIINPRLTKMSLKSPLVKVQEEQNGGERVNS